MALVDPIREKGRELSGLARRLSEHLGGRNQEEWSESEVTAMMHGLRRAMSELEEHLGLPTPVPPADGATSRKTGAQGTGAVAPAVAQDSPAGEAAADSTEEDSTESSQLAKVAIATRSLDPTMFVPETTLSEGIDEGPEATVGASEKPLDMSILDDLGDSDLKSFDVSKLQEKIAQDADYFKEFLGGIKKSRSPAAQTYRWTPPKGGLEGALGADADRVAFKAPQSFSHVGTLASGIGGGRGYYGDDYGDLRSVVRAGGEGATAAELRSEAEDRAESTELETFFTQVGRSLVSAQQQLDQRSQEYTAQLTAAGADPSMATLYRIPKVSAELKFAIEKVSKKGINLLVHKAGSQSSVLNQQSVNFEIAAIPAPAGTLEAVRRQAPRLQLLLGSDLRQQVLEDIAAAEASEGSHADDSAALKEAQEWLSSRPEHLLIIEAAPTAESYWVARIASTEEASGDPSRLGLWHLSPGNGEAEEPQPSRLTPVFDTETGSEQPPKVLVEFLQALAERQASFLGSL